MNLRVESGINNKDSVFGHIPQVTMSAMYNIFLSCSVGTRKHPIIDFEEFKTFNWMDIAAKVQVN